MKQTGTFNYFGKWVTDSGDSVKEFGKANIGKKLVLTIEAPKKERSLNQNSYMWGVVYNTISNYTGMTPREVHEFCKLEFNFGFKEVLNKNTGELKELRYPKSTTDLSTMDMENYLEAIRRYFMIEFNLYIPLPNEAL